jgi:hypothetical protein
MRYIGPERRRQGLLECAVCERRLRPQNFRSVDLGICDDCRAVRHEQVRAENRARYGEGPLPRKVTFVVRDANRDIAEIREFQR